MKMSSVSGFRTSNFQSFKGLWGKPNVDAISAPGAVYRRINEFYYPFKNEPQTKIDQAVSLKTYTFKADWDETMGDIYDDNSQVILKDELAFTEEEYNHYKDHKYDKPEFLEKKERIEKSLEENHLKEYKNRKTGFFKKHFGK